MRFDLGTLDSDERSLPFRLLVFLVRVVSLSGVMPFEKIRMESCQKYVSKSIRARGLKLGQLIEDDE